MEVSIHKILSKLEEELIQARSTNSETKIRERISAIKSLCELVLEEPKQNEKNASGKKRTTTKNQQSFAAVEEANKQTMKKRSESYPEYDFDDDYDDDEDSILDF